MSEIVTLEPPQDRAVTLEEARQQLRDLLGKLDGNDELDALLENTLQNTEDLKALQGAEEAAATTA